MGKGGRGKGESPPDARVFVGNLSWEVSWQDLKDHMRQAGEVVHADVMLEDNGRSKGCGLVAYSSAEEAQAAVEELHDSELKGRKIFVREDREPLQQECRVYVGNLAWSVTWQDLKDHFQSPGDAIVRADVITEGNVVGGRSKGYGIVVFKTKEDAEAAIDEFHDTELHDRKIFCREDRESEPIIQGKGGGGKGKGGYSSGGYGKGSKGKGKGKGYGKSGKDGEDECKVFVANLSWDTSWQDLKDHMRDVGEVTYAEVMTEKGEKGGRSKGCGIVQFTTFGAARRACERLHDSMLKGRQILVREFSI